MYYNNNGFDHIVSLGYNCEVSQRISDYTRNIIESYPFSWILFYNPLEIVNVIKNIYLVPSSEIRYRNDTKLFYVDKLNIGIHAKEEIDDYEKLGYIEKKKYDEKSISEIRSRFSYLINKWDNLLNSDESTLFVIKIDSIYDFNSSKEIIVELNDYFSMAYKSNRYLLLAVFSNKEMYEYNKVFKNEHIVYSLIKEFASNDRTEDSGDVAGFVESIEYYNHYWDLKTDYMDFTNRKKENPVILNIYKNRDLYNLRNPVTIQFNFNNENGLSISYNYKYRAEQMEVAVWTEESQSDLIWYKANKDYAGNWSIIISKTKHFNLHNLNVHIYEIIDNEKRLVHGINNFNIDFINN